MKKEFKEIIQAHGLSPFNRTKTQVKTPNNTIFKTKDAKAIHAKVIFSISRNFSFSDTANLLSCFAFTQNPEEIARRQEFFRGISPVYDNFFLRGMELSRKSWRPPYGIVVATEDEKTFVALQKMGCPVKILLNERDVMELQESDIVQVIDCEQYSIALERLPQSVFLNSIDEAYMERFVEKLSEWAEVLKVLGENKLDSSSEELVKEIYELLPLLEKKDPDKITREQVEESLDEIKEEISQKVREMSVSGESLIEVLSKGVIPPELKVVVEDAILKTGLPSGLFLKNIPVSIDEAELEKTLRKQDITEFMGIAEKIKAKGKELIGLPEKLAKLSESLLIYDFMAGVREWMEGKESFPTIGGTLELAESKNIFLNEPQAITFHLSSEARCSILTGANSGGKTTLLEHILQVISCLQLGLPLSGRAQSPLFSEVYYFAKTKGSMSKGAFETLLTQMSEIVPGERTLILADEIEAVTEPGVAGKMISATAQYFINKNCFLVIATHLGHEINKNLPNLARIDGIEAKGLTADNELIVDHNPILGRLAHSTPELIIEKMVNTQGGEYFRFLHESVRKRVDL